MKLEVREDAGTALPLMESVLSPGKPLGLEYPLVFAPGALGRVVVAEEDGEVRSTCAILRRVLTFPDESVGTRQLPIGLIGSVSTSASFRGRGLASSVLELAERQLLEQGCVLSLLWADAPEFYAARGYQPIGMEVDFVLEESLCAGLPGTKNVRNGRIGDHASLHELYLDHDRRVERSAAESAALYSTPGMEVLVLSEGGSIKAYACLGRGHDLEGVIHEWAGQPRAVLACIRAHMEAQRQRGHEGPLFLMAPGDSRGLGACLTELGAPSAAGVLGMGKLLDPVAVALFLRQACADDLDISINSSGGGELSLGPRSVEIGADQWLDLLVPPRGDREPLEGLERRLRTRFAGLPWIPFLWGLDSI